MTSWSINDDSVCITLNSKLWKKIHAEIISQRCLNNVVLFFFFAPLLSEYAARMRTVMRFFRLLFIYSRTIWCPRLAIKDACASVQHYLTVRVVGRDFDWRNMGSDLTLGPVLRKVQGMHEALTCLILLGRSLTCAERQNCESIESSVERDFLSLQEAMCPALSARATRGVNLSFKIWAP